MARIINLRHVLLGWFQEAMATICIDAMNAAGDATYTFGRTSGNCYKIKLITLFRLLIWYCFEEQLNEPFPYKCLQ